jgi:hypothetical protein
LLYSNYFALPKVDEWIYLCKLWPFGREIQGTLIDLTSKFGEDNSTDTLDLVPALQNQVVGVFSSRFYQREVRRLDLEILHYVYDNTGPGSRLRMLFTNASIWYGNQDVFAKMTNDMPPMLFADYVSQEADRAHKLKEGASIDAWYLTEYLLSEVSTDGGMEMAKVDVDLDGEDLPKRRSGGPLEERQTKRKKPSDAEALFREFSGGTGHLPE